MGMALPNVAPTPRQQCSVNPPAYFPLPFRYTAVDRPFSISLSTALLNFHKGIFIHLWESFHVLYCIRTGKAIVCQFREKPMPLPP